MTRFIALSTLGAALLVPAGASAFPTQAAGSASPTGCAAVATSATVGFENASPTALGITGPFYAALCSP
jgi:hypothetical protein